MIETIYITGQAKIICPTCNDSYLEIDLVSQGLDDLQTEVEGQAQYLHDWKNGICPKCQPSDVQAEVEAADNQRREELL